MKYSLTEEDTWHKFSIEKKRSACPTFPTELAYSALLPLSQEMAYVLWVQRSKNNVCSRGGEPVDKDKDLPNLDWHWLPL